MIKNLIILILILAIIAVVVFLDLPKAQEILALKKQLEEEKKVFSEKQILLAKVEKLSKDYQENEEELKKISYILPSGQDLPNLIVQLEALAFEGGLILEKMEFFSGEMGEVGKAQAVRQEGEVVTRDYRTLAIKLSLIGDYLAFKSFLKAVEENIRLMDVSSVNFSTQLGEQAEFFNFDLSLETYYK